ncbi:S26 family signal peptidase [Actinoallomurus sp. NPDC052274]|uniref:S26 family signal peptidase n=1 Tax=Actinoallomurus sp. NPDC052274 TaxID=3155420 RepID=UPI003427EDBC
MTTNAEPGHVKKAVGHPQLHSQPDGSPHAWPRPRAPRSFRGRERSLLLLQAGFRITAVALWMCTLTALFTTVSGWTLVYASSALAFSIASTAAAYLGRRFVAVTISGVSMEPTYHDGDRVLVRRKRTLVPGQVVVVESPTREVNWVSSPIPEKFGAGAVPDRCWMIKRVVAVSGDPVPRDQAPALAHVPEDYIPSGKLVLLGDNREKSFDSRQIGYFPVERVLGVVLRS